MGKAGVIYKTNKMDKTIFTLQAKNAVRGLHFSIDTTYDVYIRMLKYLDEHKKAYKIISTKEYIGRGENESDTMGSNYIIQFEWHEYYHDMVNELVLFEKKTLSQQ